MTAPIAIVGMACRYPDARSPDELWENVLAQRRSFRRMPDERLRLEDYFSEDRAAADAFYSTQAAVIEGFEFDRVRFRVAGSTYRAADLAHWLALDVAARALEDAGFADGKGLPRETTGAIVGNTLTGEFSRANVMRLRWPYVRRVVAAELERDGMAAERVASLLESLERTYKQPFPEIGEETLAGGLSNTIAGRVCNLFDLKGGGYTVDGACAASLLAVITACRSLESGDLDVALAGGVDLSLDPFELVGFAKVGALAQDEMRVYDTRSQGFWPGEGCGFVVLMRHDRAIAEGRRIYGLIRGWGVSSDGAGGITRPEVEGQMLAVERAYRRAGFGPDTVDYFEGHGTGTVIGDATELEVLSRARRAAGADAAPAAIGSIKANFGHTKAAAGIAGLLKATLALHHRVLPPTTGCERPHAELTAPSPALRVLRRPEAWPHAGVARAAVSAMGFGGINTHVVLEAAATSVKPAAPATNGGAAMAPTFSPTQDAELFLFRDVDAAGLARRIDRNAAYAARLSRAELTDLAATLARDLPDGDVRAAIVASRPEALAASLATLRRWIAEGVSERIDAEAGIFLAARSRAPRVAFLFSGQASPVHRDGGALGARFERADERYRRAEIPAGDAVETRVAQPAIVTSSLAALDALETLGLDADVAAGHSLGEITGLAWAGVIEPDAAARIAVARGRAMMNTPGPPSGMASVGAPADAVSPLLAGTPVVFAGLNLPHQTVVSGPLDALEAVSARARLMGWRVARLPVSHAFHSPLMAPAAAELEAALARETARPPRRALVSTITGAVLTDADDPRVLLRHQLTHPVRFMDAVRAMGDVDLVIEVGPGRVLTELARQLVAAPVIAIEAGDASLRGLLHVLGAAHALGATFDHAALFRDRLARPFDLDWSPRFFVNPCELAPVGSSGRLAAARPEPEPARAAEPVAANADQDPLELMRRLVAERAELPLTAVTGDSRLLDDLHLNSISVAQLVATASKRLGLPASIAPQEFADATVAEVARALAERLRTGAAGVAPRETSPAGVDSWIRTFTVELVERPATLAAPAPSSSAAAWRVFAPDDYPLRDALVSALESAGGRGIVVALPPEPDDRHVAMLLAGAKAAIAEAEPGRFVLVQHGGGAAGFARTLFLEAPAIATLVVDVPIDHPRAVEWVAREAMSASRYTEVHYDRDGVRRIPVLRPFALPEAAALPIGAGDVLLVTGGGKGIAAECALALARETGCRLVLIGRSDPDTDAELAANLERMDAAGVVHRYVRADVTDREAMVAGIRAAERALGGVNAILCGAGINEPQLIRALDEQAFMKTIAAKVQGARNVLETVDLSRLKLFVAFGSIIARSGLRGEADYALANEWLTRLTGKLAARCQQARCLSVEWTVWSGVGMGERLGRVDTLVEQGVTPITPDEGVAILRRLIGSPLATTSVIVSGRFGDIETLRVDRPELPLRRFLERPRVHFPGIELIAEADLTSDADPYLDDHVFAGEKLLPAVMGLEAMAQVAMAVAGSDAVPAFEDVRFDRPVVVGAGAPSTIRIAALVREPGCVEVALRCQETDFQVDHFRARCVFGAEAVTNGGSETGRAANGHAREVEPERIAIDLERDLYGGILFHRGRFRRIQGYRRLRARECSVELLATDDAAWFGRYLPATLALGDPAARDSAIHAVQACIPHATILPTGVDRIELTARAVDGVRIVDARERSRDGSTLVYDVTVSDASGAVRERWQGLRLRIVADATRPTEWPAALLGPYLERRFAELVDGSRLAVSIEAGEGERPARSDRALAGTLGIGNTVRRRPDGKPEAEDGTSVSTAHAGALTLAVAGSGAVACDLETVEARGEAAWRDLLGAERAGLAERIAKETAEPYDTAATRVWSAVECLKKSGLSPITPLIWRGASRDGWVELGAGRLAIGTCATRVRDAERTMVIAMLAERSA